MKKIRSPLIYMGSKYKLLDWLFPMFPEQYDIFIDMFGGSGTVVLNYKQNNDGEAIYIEKNINVYKIMEYIRDNSVLDLKTKIKKYIEDFNLEFENPKADENKQAYLTFREYVNNNKEHEDHPLFLLLLSRLCFRHSIDFNSKGDFNSSYGQYKINIEYLTDVVITAHYKLLNIALSNIDSLNEFDFFLANLTENSFVYADPPYIDTVSKYTKNWTEQDDEKLWNILDSINDKGAKFGLSNYYIHDGKVNQKLIDWANSKGYHIYYKQNDYRPTDSTIHQTTEVYICNYNVTN